VKIAAGFRSLLFAVAVLSLLPAFSAGQGVLPSQWVYGSITAANSIAYSPDGKLLALAGNGGVQIWTVSTSTLLTCLPTEAARVNGIAFSPDGHTLALGGAVSLYGEGGSVLELWNASTGKFIRSLNSQCSTVNSVSFSANGKLLADGGWWPTKLEVWEVSTGKQVASLATGINSVSSVKFAPTGTILAAGGYCGSTCLELWDAATEKLIRSLNTVATEVVSLSFSPDGKSLAAGGYENTASQYNSGTAEVWDVSSGKLDTSLQSGSTFVGSLAYSPDGTTIAVTSSPLRSDSDVTLWSASTYNLVATLQDYPSRVAGVLAFAPNGKSLSTFADVYIGYTATSYTQFVSWDLPAGNQAIAFTTEPYNQANAVTFSPDGKRIALGGFQVSAERGGGWIGVWNSETKELTASFNSTSPYTVTSVAISPDGSLLADAAGSAQYGSVLEVWNIATGKLVQSIPASTRGVITSIAFSPTGGLLAEGGGASDVQVWNASTGALVADLNTAATNGVTSLAFSPNGEQLVIAGSAGEDGYQSGVLEVWNASSGLLLHGLSTGLYSLANVAFSHDGSMIADGGLRYIPNLNEVAPTVEVWNSSLGAQSPTYLTFADESYPIGSLAFTADDKTLFAVVSQGIQAFEISSGDLLAAFNVGPVTQMSLSPKGDQLAYAMNTALAVTGIPSFASSQIASVTLDPTEVVGGSISTGTVTLAHSAPAGGIGVNLSSNSPLASVLPSITVAGGSTKATFDVNTIGVDSQTAVAITAAAGNDKKSAKLKIDPPTLASIQVTYSSLPGGQYEPLVVNLSGPAGPSGVTLTVKCTGPASVPATASVSAGESSTNISIDTLAVAAPIAATITVTEGSVSKSVTFTITPPVLADIYLDPFDILGGSSSVGTVIVDGVAPAGGITIGLSSGSALVSVPSSVTITAGSSGATFTAKTSSVTTRQSVTLTATFGSASVTTKVILEPPTLGPLSLNPYSVQGGQSSTGTVTIGSPAPAGGLVIMLSSNIPAATVPATVTIPVGMTSATFTISTTPVPSTTGATIRATLGTATVSQVLSIS
jgi:WD40 repeat protein